MIMYLCNTIMWETCAEYVSWFILQAVSCQSENVQITLITLVGKKSKVSFSLFFFNALSCYTLNPHFFMWLHTISYHTCHKRRIPAMCLMKNAQNKLIAFSIFNLMCCKEAIWNCTSTHIYIDVTLQPTNLQN